MTAKGRPRRTSGNRAGRCLYRRTADNWRIDRLFVSTDESEAEVLEDGRRSSISEDLFSEYVGVPAMMGQFAQYL